MDSLVEFYADGPVLADVLEDTDPSDCSELGSVVGHPHDPLPNCQRSLLLLLLLLCWKMLNK